MRPCIVTNFFIVKSTRCTNFTNFLALNSTCFGQFVCPIISSLFTVHSAVVYVIQLWSRTRMELHFHPDPARKLSTNLYDIHHC